MLILASAKWILAFILLVYRRNKNQGVYFLAAALVILSLFDVNHHLTFGRGSSFLLAIVYHHVSPLLMLVGPLISAYVKSTLSDRIRLRPWDFMHTIPFWIVFLDLTPYYTLPFTEKIQFAERIIADINSVRESSHHLYLDHFSMNFLRAGLALAYCTYSLILLYVYIKAIPEHPEVPRRQSKITLRWMCILIGSLTAISISYILLMLEKRNVPLSVDTFEYSPFFILIVVFYAVMSVSLLFFPEILYGLPRAKDMGKENIPADSLDVISSTSSMPGEAAPKETQEEDATHYKVRDDDPFRELANAILAYLENEKPYLKPDFCVTDIVVRFGAPRHHVEYCFSKLIGERFTDLRKRLRVDYARQLIPLHQNLSMEGVGKESGFASKSVFFGAFREITGMTPADYLQWLGKKGELGSQESMPPDA